MSRYEQFERSPETIQQELRPSVFEQRQRDLRRFITQISCVQARECYEDEHTCMYASSESMSFSAPLTPAPTGGGSSSSSSSSRLHILDAGVTTNCVATTVFLRSVRHWSMRSRRFCISFSRCFCSASCPRIHD